MRPQKRRLFLDDAGTARSTLAEDVAQGLTSHPKTLPPKYFYDERGSKLFEAICHTEEYYATRAEEQLLGTWASDWMGRFRPDALVELGSGAARKARLLLGACADLGLPCAYLPVDVSASSIRRSADELLEAFPWLEVHGLVGDYASDLHRLPDRGRKVVAFLGGTIGNLEPGEDSRLLGAVGRHLTDEDHLLLGVQLVCDHEILHRAYNDRQGLTAAFNQNILHVINRALGSDFDPARFEHLAFYQAEREQVEMHLRATEAHRVDLGRLGLEVAFERGETIRTEISRKFTRASVEALLSSAGLALESWAADDRVGIAVARRARAG